MGQESRAAQKVNRRIAYQLYPTPTQERAMLDMLGKHRLLYNGALEQRITAYKRAGKSLGYVDQCRELTDLRADDPDYAGLNCHSARVTLKRLDLAYAAFFRRVKAGQTAGFPRFKSFGRFSGWGYDSSGGYKLCPGDNGKHGRLELVGIGSLRLRGRPKSYNETRTLEISRKGEKWFATLSVVREADRKAGRDVVAFDWGIETFATLAVNDGCVVALNAVGPGTGRKARASRSSRLSVLRADHLGNASLFGSNIATQTERIENPRFFANHEASITRAARNLDAVTVKDKIGRPLNWADPIRIAAKAGLQRAMASMANTRKDFLHKTSALIVGRSSVIATEKLQISNMVRSAKGIAEEPGKNVAAKSGLNREILATAPSTFLSMLRYKAEEAGSLFLEAPTRTLKPSQRCSDCGVVVKKALSTRQHLCPCGCRLSRDENASRVILTWALNYLGREPAESATAVA
jgi:putative transposase